jgi:hypothetical protein
VAAETRRVLWFEFWDRNSSSSSASGGGDLQGLQVVRQALAQGGEDGGKIATARFQGIGMPTGSTSNQSGRALGSTPQQRGMIRRCRRPPPLLTNKACLISVRTGRVDGVGAEYTTTCRAAPDALLDFRGQLSASRKLR